MNDNNINVNVDNEEVISPVYSSRFLMNKDLYYDFCSVNYHRTKKLFLIFLCLSAYVIGLNLLVGNYDIVIGWVPFMAFLMLLIYIRINKVTKIGYERMIISEGKEPTIEYELFEDKIVSHNDGKTREYFYPQVTKLFETKNFILLHLKHDLHVTIEKNGLSASADEVKTFLMNKCTSVKKKKFINCENAKKQSFVFLIALIVVSVAGIAIGTAMSFERIS